MRTIDNQIHEDSYPNPYLYRDQDEPQQNWRETMEKQYRHGDILLERLTDQEVEQNSRGVIGKFTVLAEGEATGHVHAFDTPVFQLPAGLIDVPEGGSNLTHQEHETIHIPEGTYRIIRQRERVDGGFRTVAD